LGKSCDKGQVALPWSDDAIRSAFSQFDDDRDGEVHKENLPAMLKHLGCRPGASDTEQLAQQQTQYSTVSYEEFVDFLRQYHELDCSKLRELFLGADVNKDGSMDLPELHALLNRLGFALSQQATVEALQELDHDMNTVLSFSEFIGLRDYLQQNEGMTKADVEELRELFEKVKENTTSGANTIKECWRICNYLGYPIAEHEFSQIVRTTDLDCDLSEGMAWGDLLKIIRRIRERERSSLSALASKHGADNQTFPISELSTVLADFGYMVSEEAIFECLDKFDEVEEEDTLTVDELAIFLREYRKVEGFTNAEIEEFERAFMEQSQADAAGMEGLDTLATGRVLRWFGIATTLQQVQTLLEQLDFDGSGRLEFNEFVKLMRRIHQEQATRVRRLFDQLTMQEAAPYIAIDALPNAVALFEGAPADPLLVAGAMEKAGLRDAVGADLESTRRIVSPLMKRREADSSPCAASAVEVAQDGGKPLPAVKRQTLTVGQLPLFAEDNSPSSSPSNAASKQQREKTPRGYASRRGFQEFFRQWNKVAVDTVRQRAGYGALEVAKLRAAFNQFDKDGNGTIESTEFRDLIANYFPDATKSRQGQKDVLKMMKDAREDHGEGNPDRALDFNEFLQLIRMCDDRRDQADIELEKQVLQECDLSQEDADGFRQIFSTYVDWTGELEMEKIARLLSEVIDISEKQLLRLAQIVTEVHPHGRPVARFPQFLRLISRLTQENYGGLNASTNRALKTSSASHP